jgi:hypothetical protein
VSEEQEYLEIDKNTDNFHKALLTMSSLNGVYQCVSPFTSNAPSPALALEFSFQLSKSQCMIEGNKLFSRRFEF